MIGVSLPLSLLSRESAEREDMLSTLSAQGVKSIELRTVRRDCVPEEAAKIAKMLWKKGFSVTVHGEVKSLDTCIEDLFFPLSLLLSLCKSTLCITFHPIAGDNRALLEKLSDHAKANALPVMLCLENNRRLPDKSEGDSLALVYRAVSEAARENVGICFDMGHYAYYLKKTGSALLPVAPKEVLPWIRHTHIHALKDLRTHFPLGDFDLPVKEIIFQMSHGYYGVYNLELDFPRLAEDFSPVEAVNVSLPVLRRALPPTAFLYDRIREEFDVSFQKALSVKETEENAVSLIHSSSYLFATRGYFWAMDIAFRACWDLAQGMEEISERLRDLKLIVVTHGHRDHLEEKTVRALAKNDTLWLIPDFLKEKALSFGLPPEKMILAEEGKDRTVGPLSILPFRGRHFRPVSGRGVRSFGYLIRVEDGPVLAFPGDVRDYSEPLFPFENADLCFAHVWLSDDNRNEETYTSVPLFARFMLSASQKRILLAHLYENGREDHKMWQGEHAKLIKKEILSLSPETEVIIPDWGERIKL